MKRKKETKRLSLNTETLKHLPVRSGVQAGAESTGDCWYNSRVCPYSYECPGSRATSICQQDGGTSICGVGTM